MHKWFLEVVHIMLFRIMIGKGIDLYTREWQIAHLKIT